MQEKITKDKIDFLIDTLITSGGGQNQYGKLNDIIKTYTTENSLIRTTMLIWLDTMGIMEVDKQYNYYFNKPVWVKSSIKEHFILYGALTRAEKDKLELNGDVKKYTENRISYKNFEIELPDTYYTSNSDVFKQFEFDVLDTPIFSAIENMEGLSSIKEKLQTGKLKKLIYPKEHQTDDVDGYTITLNTNLDTLTIFPQDDIKQFNWRTRNYIKCDINRELNLELEEEGLKLFKITNTKFLERNHKEYYTILLEKEKGEEVWNYFYFDRDFVDERWARYIYIDKLEFYDIEKDFRGREVIDKISVYRNIESAFSAGSDIVNYNADSNNFMKIPNIMKKQLVQYDSRQGLMAFPISMPLPKEIMRYLFSCSGIVPQVFKNKFVINPDYNIKRLFSGVLSPNGNNVYYPDEKYFMEENFYLFSSVPTQLAEKIFEKLNLDIKDEVFKRTFLQKV
jgi:hypothetical protein